MSKIIARGLACVKCGGTLDKEGNCPCGEPHPLMEGDE